MNLSYSYSRRETLEKCPRQYFYDYYAHAEGVPFDDELKAEVIELRKLTGCFLHAGNVLHRYIKAYITKYTNKERPWSIDWTLKTLFDKDIKYSINPESFPNIQNEKYPPKMMMEFFYNQENARDKALEARSRLGQSINTFNSDKAIVNLWKSFVRGKPYIEEWMNGLSINDVEIKGIVDLYSLENANLRILDWKMSSFESQHDSLQLFIYGIWGAQNYEIDPSDITIQKVYLGDGTIEEPRTLSEQDMNRGNARLIQDIEHMNQMHPYGMSGNEKAFTPCDNLKVCAMCKYQKVCKRES